MLATASPAPITGRFRTWWTPAAAVLARAGLGPTVRRLDIVMAADAADLPEELREVVGLLPPGDYTRQRLCVQLNSAIGGHGWGQVYGTVE